MSFSEKILACKSNYPFEFWLENFNEGFGEYSPEYCEYVERNFNNLIDSLIKLGETASIENKKECFKNLIEELNELRRTKTELIESMEREEYCELYDDIALAVGLEGCTDGRSIADEWRSW